MATLAKRATPAQALVLRMIEGAVRNAGHAHPEWRITDKMARSISKRAAGTLTSQWRDVLAAHGVAPSDGNDGVCEPPLAGRAECASATKGVRGGQTGAWRGVELQGHAPLRRLRVAIGALARDARREGSADRLEAFAEVLRLIAREMDDG